MGIWSLADSYLRCAGMTFPQQPNESTPLGHWLRKLLRACIASRILPGSGYFVKTTATGTILEIRPGGGGSSKPQPHRFKSMGTDHLICRTWDGTNQGTTDVLIAKPPTLWFSVASKVLRGTTITYSAYSLTGQSRTSTSASKTETELITPSYETDDIIWAVSGKTFVSTGTPPTELTLCDDNRGSRAWMAQ